MTPVNPQEMTSVFAVLTAPGATQPPGAAAAAQLPFAGLLQGLLPAEQAAGVDCVGMVPAGPQEPVFVPKGAVQAAGKNKAATTARPAVVERTGGAEAQELSAASIAQILATLARPEALACADCSTSEPADRVPNEQFPPDTGKKSSGGDDGMVTQAESSPAVIPQAQAAAVVPAAESSAGRPETRLSVEVAATVPRTVVSADAPLQERPAARKSPSAPAVLPQAAPQQRPAETQITVVTDRARSRSGEPAVPAGAPDTESLSRVNVTPPQTEKMPSTAGSQPAPSAAPAMQTASIAQTTFTKQSVQTVSGARADGADAASSLPAGGPLDPPSAPRKTAPVPADAAPAPAGRTLPVDGTRDLSDGVRDVSKTEGVVVEMPQETAADTGVRAVPPGMEKVNPGSPVADDIAVPAGFTESPVQGSSPAAASAAIGRFQTGAPARPVTLPREAGSDIEKTASAGSNAEVPFRAAVSLVERVKESTPGGMKHDGYDREERRTAPEKGEYAPQSGVIAGRAADAPVSARFLLEPKTEAAESKLHSHILEQVTSSIVSHDGKGNGTITVKLNPLELGELQVSVKIENQTVKVEIFTDNRTVREALMGNMESLKETFQKQNLTMERFDVSTGGGSGFSQGFREERGEQQRAQALANVVDVPAVRTGRAQGNGDTEETENSLVNLRL